MRARKDIRAEYRGQATHTHTLSVCLSLMGQFWSQKTLIFLSFFLSPSLPHTHTLSLSHNTDRQTDRQRKGTLRRVDEAVTLQTASSNLNMRSACLSVVMYREIDHLVFCVWFVCFMKLPKQSSYFHEITEMPPVFSKNAQTTLPCCLNFTHTSYAYVLLAE